MESGWKAVDVTPGYYYNVATLQKMVNTPEQIKKNVALKNNGYKGKQTAGSGKSDRDLTDKMKDAAKNTAMILLGAVTVLVIAGFILFVILEIRLWLLEQTLKKQYEQADMDQKITDCFETIESGNYERACGLMEKTIYGEIELELFEERTVRSFRDKLAEEAKGLAVAMQNFTWFFFQVLFVGGAGGILVQTTLAGLGYEVELIDLAAAEIPVALVALVVSCAFVIVKDNKLMKKYYGKSTDTKK